MLSPPITRKVPYVDLTEVPPPPHPLPQTNPCFTEASEQNLETPLTLPNLTYLKVYTATQGSLKWGGVGGRFITMQRKTCTCNKQCTVLKKYQMNEGMRAGRLCKSLIGQYYGGGGGEADT
jgi:hypothetical protein